MKEKNTNAMQHNAAGTATETNPDDIPLQQSSLLLRKGDIEQDENVFQFDYKVWWKFDSWSTWKLIIGSILS